MEVLDLKSGNKLYIELAPISESWRLFQIVVAEFKKNNIDIKVDFETEINFYNIIKDNTKEVLFGLADIVISNYVLKQILNCAEKCIYEKDGVKQRISLEIFEDVLARADFIDVLKSIAIYNLKPFFRVTHTK